MVVKKHNNTCNTANICMLEIFHSIKVILNAYYYFIEVILITVILEILPIRNPKFTIYNSFSVNKR